MFSICKLLGESSLCSSIQKENQRVLTFGFIFDLLRSLLPWPPLALYISNVPFPLDQDFPSSFTSRFPSPMPHYNPSLHMLLDMHAQVYICISSPCQRYHYINRSIDMAFNGTEEDILKLLESHRLYSFINVELDPCQHPEHLPTSAYATDGRAYFYLNFDKVSGQVSGNGWKQDGYKKAIRDVSEIIGFKETYKFATNRKTAKNWSMTKYYLDTKSSSKNENAIYVISNN